jgi:hypothetical protein
LAPPPLAEQAVAPTDDHVKVKDLPVVTEEALEVRLAVSGPIVSFACADTEGEFGSML